jgi:hypothetical protein
VYCYGKDCTSGLVATKAISTAIYSALYSTQEVRVCHEICTTSYRPLEKELVHESLTAYVQLECFTQLFHLVKLVAAVRANMTVTSY